MILTKMKLIQVNLSNFAMILGVVESTDPTVIKSRGMSLDFDFKQIGTCILGFT